MDKRADSLKMAEVLRELKVQKNGAVTDAMCARGIKYGVNYGVSVPTIRDIASNYAPDHTLAKLCWRQAVRELKIAAIYMIVPEQVEDDLIFWMDGIDNRELAEHFATGVVSKVGNPLHFMNRLLDSDNHLVKYSAILGANRALEREDLESFLEVLHGVATDGDPLITRAISTLLEGVALRMDGGVEMVVGFLNGVESRDKEAAGAIRSEVEWLLAETE